VYIFGFLCLFFFFSSRRRHTRFSRDWSSDVCSSDLNEHGRLIAAIGTSWVIQQMHLPQVRTVVCRWASVAVAVLMLFACRSGAVVVVPSHLQYIGAFPVLPVVPLPCVVLVSHLAHLDGAG